tara:strand:- start:796 stop:1785 length:990 start_codon:yes stop_codon:yes gene_type:complete
MQLELSEIQFCDGIEKHLISNNQKTELINKLINTTNITNIHYIPHNVLTHNLYNNISTEYVITPFAKGFSCILYITNYLKKNYCFLIDQRIKAGYKLPKILIMDWQFANSVYNDTLIYGILGEKQNKWTFMLYDLLYYKSNEWMLNSNIVNRHYALNQILDYYNPKTSKLNNIQISRIFNNNQLQNYSNYLKLYPLNIIGILFVNENIQEHYLYKKKCKKSKLLQQIIKQIRETKYSKKIEFVCECEKQNNIGKIYLLVNNEKTYLQDILIDNIYISSDINVVRLLLRYDYNLEEFVFSEITPHKMLTRWKGSLSTHISPNWGDDSDDD